MQGLWAARSCVARFSRVGLSAPAALLLPPLEPHRPHFPMATSVGNVADSTGTEACVGTGAPEASSAAAVRSLGTALARCLAAACAPRGRPWLALSAALPARRARSRRNFPEAAAWVRPWLPARPPPPLCSSPFASGCRWARACPSAGSVSAAWPQPATLSWRRTARLVLSAVLYYCYIYPTVS